MTKAGNVFEAQWYYWKNIPKYRPSFLHCYETNTCLTGLAMLTEDEEELDKKGSVLNVVWSA